MLAVWARRASMARGSGEHSRSSGCLASTSDWTLCRIGFGGGGSGVGMGDRTSSVGTSIVSRKSRAAASSDREVLSLFVRGASSSISMI